MYHNPGFQCGSLENEEQYNNFKTANEVDVEIEFCSISRLIEGEIVTEVIIDNRLTKEDRQNENDLNALENSGTEY